MALIRRSSLTVPRQWNTTQAPTWPAEINWSHELSSGLVYAMVASQGLRDLVNYAAPLNLDVNVGFAGTATGPAYLNNADYSELYTTAPSSTKTTSGTTFWNGQVYGAADNAGVPIFGITPDNSGGSPYQCYGMLISSGYFSAIDYGTAAIAFQPMTYSVQTLASTFVSGGAVLGYYNGVQVGSGTTATISYSSTSQIIIGGYPATSPYAGRNPNIGTVQALIYNKVLSAALLAWLNAEPFAMLRPIVRRSFSISSIAAFIVSLSDAIASSDSLSGAMASTTTLTDSATTSSAITPLTAAIASLTDAAASSDALSGAAASAASWSDTGLTTDTTSGTLSAAASLTDASATTDSLAGAAGALAALTDTAITSDALATSLAAAANLSDAAVTADALTGHGAAAWTLSETASGSDYLSGVAASTYSLADAVASSDTLATVFGFSAVLADLVATSDAVAGISHFAWSIGDVAITVDAFTVAGSHPSFTPSPQRTDYAATVIRFGFSKVENRALSAHPSNRFARSS